MERKSPREANLHGGTLSNPQPVSHSEGSSQLSIDHLAENPSSRPHFPGSGSGFNRAACRKLAEQLGVTQEYAEDHFAPKVPEFERVISFDGREELFVSDCGKLVIRRDGGGESVTPRQSVRWMQAWFERSPGGYDSDTEAFARWLKLVAAEMA